MINPVTGLVVCMCLGAGFLISTLRMASWWTSLDQILAEIVQSQRQLEQDRRDQMEQIKELRQQMQVLSIKLDGVEQACSGASSSTAAHPNPDQGSGTLKDCQDQHFF
jgi:hypothetical protein